MPIGKSDPADWLLYCTVLYSTVSISEIRGLDACEFGVLVVCKGTFITRVLYAGYLSKKKK